MRTYSRVENGVETNHPVTLRVRSYLASGTGIRVDLVEPAWGAREHRAHLAKVLPTKYGLRRLSVADSWVSDQGTYDRDRGERAATHLRAEGFAVLVED